MGTADLKDLSWCRIKYKNLPGPSGARKSRMSFCAMTKAGAYR